MENDNANSTKNKPVHEIRMGAIKCVVWANKAGDNGVMYNVVPVRLYRIGDGEWNETHSLGRDDLLVAAKLLDAAHTWICETEQSERKSRRSQES